MKESGKRKSALIREVQQLRRQIAALRSGQGDLHRAERALAQYWSLLDAVLSGTRDLYSLKGTNYRYQAANQAFCRFIGLSEHEIRGRGDFELFPDGFAQIAHRDDIRVLQAGVPVQYETRLTFHESARWLQLQKRPVLNSDGRCIGILCVINDVTELARFRAQQQVFTGAGNNGSWCTDAHGYILDVNHTYCEKTGYSRDELLGKNLLDIEMMTTPEALSRTNQRIMKEGAGACKALHRTKSNGILEFEVSAVFTREQGGRFYRFFRDCPSASPVEATPPAPALPELKEGTIPHRKVFNLNHILVTAIDQEIDQIPPGISIRKRLDHALNNTVANQAQITQVIINMVANAVEAMDGRGHLTFTTRNVELTREWMSNNPELPPGHYVYLAIGDTGRGIPPALIGKIFDPFITTKFKGRGMGLASASRNIAEHHGLITVKSEVDKGSTFTFYLPATSAPLESGATTPQIPAGTEVILFVDPESRVLEEGRRILERLAYTVLLAPDLEEAIACIGAHSPPVDMVVIDTEASLHYNGDFLGALRRAAPKIKIILAGAHELDTWAQDILDQGAHGYIKKPFRPEVLAPKIRLTLDS